MWSSVVLQICAYYEPQCPPDYVKCSQAIPSIQGPTHHVSGYKTETAFLHSDLWKIGCYMACHLPCDICKFAHKTRRTAHGQFFCMQSCLVFLPFCALCLKIVCCAVACCDTEDVVLLWCSAFPPHVGASASTSSFECGICLLMKKTYNVHQKNYSTIPGRTYLMKKRIGPGEMGHRKTSINGEIILYIPRM